MYHTGRVVFSYLGDIWTADENGQNVQRLTVNKARDVYPRFSPDGKWIAFSSEGSRAAGVVVPSARDARVSRLQRLPFGPTAESASLRVLPRRPTWRTTACNPTCLSTTRRKITSPAA